MNFNILRYGTAVLASITMGTAIFYSWDRTRVKTEDIVELVEACSERILVTTEPTGSKEVLVTCGPLTNRTYVPLYNPYTNEIITTVPVLVDDGYGKTYRESDGFTNYVWKRYVTNTDTIYVTNLFISTGQWYRADVKSLYGPHPSYRIGRTMEWVTNVVNGVTSVEVRDHQIYAETNVANAVGIFNDIELLKWVDGSIRELIPKFVNHTYKTNGTYEGYFSTKTKYDTALPMWTQTEIFDAAGVGRTATTYYGSSERWFSWPTNSSSWDNYYGFNVLPPTASNLWERFKILQLLQETYVSGVTSNRYYISDGERWSTYKVETEYGFPPQTTDYLPILYSTIIPPGAYPSDGGTWYITDQNWGSPRHDVSWGVTDYMTLNRYVATNLNSAPLAYAHYKSLYTQWAYQAGFDYGIYTWMTPTHYSLSMFGWDAGRSESFCGNTNGVICRVPNANALGIKGDVDFYVRNGTAGGDAYGYLTTTLTGRCYRIDSQSSVDGSDFVKCDLSANITPLGPLSLIRTNAYGTPNHWQWWGPNSTAAVSGVSMHSGPVVTKWDFQCCKP